MKKLALVLIALPALLGAQKLSYPQTKKVDQADVYHGVKVEDPYRWLENETAPEVARWVEEENKVTFAWLEKIPYRSQLRQRLERLYDYPKIGAPSRKRQYYTFSKNDGLQNQSVLYIKTGLDGKPEVLLDPNKFSKDGTNRLAGFALSADAKYAAYGISSGGSDWSEYHVMDVATRRVLPDVIKWVKVSGLAWSKDGFFYSRYDAPDSAKALTSKNEGHKVYFHKVGTPQDRDELVYQDPANPGRFHIVSTTEDERFAVLSISDRGKGKDGNAVFVSTDKKTWKPLVRDIGNASFNVIDNIGDKFLVQTNDGAPNWKIVLMDLNGQSTVVLPERPEPLQSATSAGGKLFATYMKDVTTRAYVYDLTGKLENEVALPGPGTAGGFGGNNDDKFVFYSYTSFNAPPTIYRYDIATKKSTVYDAPQIPGFRSGDYVTKQVFYTSKDGTRVPMFLTHKANLKLDGNNPTLLYAYGGFNISTAPSFNALRLALLEQGVIYASANIRGGGEYGEKWHQAGMKVKKQNVFDDFIAAAEYLIANKYTSSPKLAIQGGSNGGLLVGAVTNQRPELFGAAIPQVGVMDMLRFHKFTIGWNWIADYGSVDDAAEFKALRAYSPIHNIRPNTKYPAVLITTADHDDRVVPAHSFKYAAAMQAAQAGPAPVLIRIDTKSGHGASSTTKALEQTADIYSFIFESLGVKPRLGVVP